MISVLYGTAAAEQTKPNQRAAPCAELRAAVVSVCALLLLLAENAPALFWAQARENSRAFCGLVARLLQTGNLPDNDNTMARKESICKRRYTDYAKRSNVLMGVLVQLRSCPPPAQRLLRLQW